MKIEQLYAGQVNASIPISSIYFPSGLSSGSFSVKVIDYICGNGIRNETEQCDDKNIIDGDGCSSACKLETGYNCTGGSYYNKDTCTEICGDGIRFNSNSTYCDDGNLNNGDGCSSNCKVEYEYICKGGSSSLKDTCKEICGDGIRLNSNTTYCDDGNLINGDGCSSTCTVESGSSCTGGSSTSKNVCSVIFTITAQEVVATKSIQIAIGAGASVSIGASLLSMTSPLGVFSMLNQFQLLYIFLTSGVYVSDGVFNLITGMSFALFSFSFINISKIYILENIYSYLSIQQTNINLNRIQIIH